MGLHRSFAYSPISSTGCRQLSAAHPPDANLLDDDICLPPVCSFSTARAPSRKASIWLSVEQRGDESRARASAALHHAQAAVEGEPGSTAAGWSDRNTQGASVLPAKAGSSPFRQPYLAAR